MAGPELPFQVGGLQTNTAPAALTLPVYPFPFMLSRAYSLSVIHRASLQGHTAAVAYI
jgi:hypothetical protein